MTVLMREKDNQPNFNLINAALKSISQVILIENTVTGAIILLAIAVSSVPLAIIAITSAALGTLVGKFGGVDITSLNKGLLGYNSVLTGIALSLFLTGKYYWLIALAGACLAAIITATFMGMMKRTELPVLTFPFIILTWFMLIAAYRFSAFQLSSELVPQFLSHWKLQELGEPLLAEGIIDGVGQIFFLDYNLSGILVLFAVFWASWKFGVYALLGNITGLFTADLLGADHILISSGLYGYNAILTIISISLVFQSNGTRKIIPQIVIGVFASMLAVLMTASVSTFLLPYGLPSLTMPFVLSTWIIIAARKIMPNL